MRSLPDASVAKGFASLDRIQAGKEMLVRIVAMLTKLLMRFDPEQYRVHESAAGLAMPFEHGARRRARARLKREAKLS